MGLAGFGAGAADVLQQMLAERRLAAIQQQQAEMRAAEERRQAEQFAQTMEMQRRRFDADEVDRAAEREYRAGQVARQTRADEAASAEAQQFDALIQGLPEHARPIVQLRRRGVTGVDEHTLETPEAHRAHISAEQDAADKRELGTYEAKKKIDLRHRPPSAESSEQMWVIRNGQVTPIRKGTAQPGDKPYDEVAARQGGKGSDGQPSQYAIDTATRTIAAIDDVLPKINAGTAGLGGMILSRIPGTPAANVSAQLATVAGNIAFNALQQMREASKTGGALGQVAIQELEMLKAVEGSLRQNQSPQNLRDQLGKVRESQARFLAAARGNTPAAGSGNREYYDANGNPVRR